MCFTGEAATAAVKCVSLEKPAQLQRLERVSLESVQELLRLELCEYTVSPDSAWVKEL